MTAVVGEPLDIALTNGTNPVRFPVINNETCINLYEFDGAMIPTPGFENILSQVSGKESRGIFYSDILNSCIIIIDDLVYRVTTETSILLGRLSTISGKVYFSENGLKTNPNEISDDPGGQIVISDGENVYIYTLDSNFVIAKDDQGSTIPFRPGTLAYQNGYFFINDLNSNKIYASKINDARIWPADNFDDVDGITRSCVAFKNLLYVFSKDRTNIFYSSPAEPAFPYAPDSSRAWEYGCLAPGSVASSQGIICWLGNTRYGNSTLLVSTGSTPVSFSTDGIDSLINGFKIQKDAEAFIYEEDGHIFYQINFILENKTLLYDFKSKKWSTLTDHTGKNKSPVRQTAYYEEENTLVGVLINRGQFIRFGTTIYSNDGEIVPRTIITQNYVMEERPKICNELDLQIEQGENRETSKICLSISKDRGRTFPINRVYELGKIGDRRNLLRWRKLGIARWWTFKFDFFSKDRFVIMKATGWFQS